MSVTIFKNATIYTPYEAIPNGAVMIAGGQIGFVGPTVELTVPPDAQVVDTQGKNICPGFIDTHLHGAKGVGFMDIDGGGVEKILSHHARHGTTSLLATTMSAGHLKLLSLCEKWGQLVGTTETGPEVLGIHLEGPYLNPEKRGIHDIDALRPPSVEEFRAYLERSGATVKLLTLAPEQPGAKDLITECIHSGIVPAVAHSTADYETIQRAKSWGLQHAVHFFNTLPTFHHRQPGVIGAVLDDADFSVELIADGIHLHPATLRLVQRLKGTDKIILVTDASPYSGLEPGEYQDRSENVITVSDRGITSADGILAGSNLTMMGAVQNMINFTGCTLSDAIRMATINPAKLIGVEQRKGSLEVGKDADLVIFDESFHIENVSFKGNLTHTF